MLKELYKKQIRTWYANLQQQNPQFNTRAAQAALIAQVAKVISGELNQDQRILLAEAGTGTGKSLAYLLAAIPLAKALNKTLVISTATVSLQQQLVEKDLPLVHRAAEGSFSFAIAKGRQRYCCQHKLREQVLAANDLNASQLKQSLQLLKQLQAGKWDGDRDNWPKPISQTLWKRIETDSLGCSPQLSHHRNCPFHKARYGLKSTRVIIANHNLLLSDLMAGSGQILPEADKCIYILDEAHQFPEIAREASACSIRLGMALKELAGIKRLDKQLSLMLDAQKIANHSLKLREACVELERGFNSLNDFIQVNNKQIDTSGHWRFAQADLPTFIKNFADNYNNDALKLAKSLEQYAKALHNAIKDNELKAAIADPKLSQLSFAQQLIESWLETLHAYRKSDNKQPYAYWISQDKHDTALHASLIEIGSRLKNILWDPAFSVIATSATLSALGRFDFFLHQAGLFDLTSAQMVKLPSPFNYQQVSLSVPNNISEPDNPNFPKEIAHFLSSAYKQGGGILLLCNSYRLMESVISNLPSNLIDDVLVQGQQTNKALLKKHAANIKQGKTSTIIATLGFSEGVDLPGELLTTLIIARLPFAVPSDPVWQSHAELLEQRKQNPFMLLTLPSASRKLIQSCGRLMRKESDSGRIILLDSRLSSRRYGKQLLAALPPFNRSEK